MSGQDQSYLALYGEEAPIKKPTERTTRSKFPVASTRIGKKQISGHLTPEAVKQLQRIAIDEETTIQALLAEGINEVFSKRGKPRIA
jgi:hypothetical protein